MLALMLAVAAFAQVPSPVALDADEYHHLITENEVARVWLEEIPPHQATALHRHQHDFLSIALSDSQVTLTPDDGAATAVDSKAGVATFIRGGFAHVVRNDSDKLYRAISVEIMKPGGEPGTLVAPTAENSTVKLEREGFHAVSVLLKPDAQLEARQSDNPMLLVPVTAVELSDKRDDRLRHLSLPPGMVEWLPAGTAHRLKNADSKPARFVLISFQ